MIDALISYSLLIVVLGWVIVGVSYIIIRSVLCALRGSNDGFYCWNK